MDPEKRLAELKASVKLLAFKDELNDDEAKELKASMREIEVLEIQIAARAELEAEATEAVDTRIAEGIAAGLAAAGDEVPEDGNGAAAEADDEPEADEAPVAEQPLAPSTGAEEVAPVIRVGSPYDRLSTMDLALRYEHLKAFGIEPSDEMWRALAVRVQEMDNTEDVVGIKNGQEVKIPALDWNELTPRQWTLTERAEADVFRGKVKRTDIGADPITKGGLMQMRLLAAKANELVYSTQANAGDEWVPTLMNAQLWRTIRLQSVVLGLFESFDMPSNPFDYPAESTDPVFYKMSETTGESQLVIDAGPYTDSKPGTAKLTFTAGKLGAISYWSEEMEEDGIIAVEPQFRDQYGISVAHDIDKVLISGDTTTATTNIFSEGATNTTASNLILDGLRHEPMITTTADKRDGGVLTIDDFGATQALMGTAGKFGVNPADLVFLSDPAVWHKAKLLGEVLTVDKFGAMATVITGQLAGVFGSPLIVSEDFGLTDATGHIDGTAADNTKGSFLCVNKRGILVGWRRRPRVRVERLPFADAAYILTSARLDLKAKEAGMVALSYNLTV